MADHPLKSARSRLERANRQIAELHTSIREFFALKPYRTFVDKDTKPGYDLYKVDLFIPMPDGWPNDVADISNNLRPPLEYAVVRVLETAGATQIKDRNKSLPVCRDLDALKRELRQRKIQAVCPKLADFIVDTIKPYPGGNDLVCGLDTLNNSKKHRDLEAICMANSSFTVDYLFVEGGVSIGLGSGYQSLFAKDGVVFFETASGTKVHGKFEFSLDVGLAKISPFERQPLTATLSKISNEVARILDAFEAEFFTQDHDLGPGT